MSDYPHSDRPKVLVVDDEESFHLLLDTRLRGYRLVPAYNGHQARQRLREHDIDLVLLDLNLPDTTGFTLAREISSRRDAPPVIAVSAHSHPRHVVRVLRAGAIDFIPKCQESYDLIPDYVRNAIVTAQLGGACREPRRSEVWALRTDANSVVLDALQECGRLLLAHASPPTSGCLPVPRRHGSIYRTIRDYFEDLLISVAVTKCGGNKRRASQVLGVSYSTVVKKSQASRLDAAWGDPSDDAQ